MTSPFEPEKAVETRIRRSRIDSRVLGVPLEKRQAYVDSLERRAALYKMSETKKFELFLDLYYATSTLRNDINEEAEAEWTKARLIRTVSGFRSEASSKDTLMRPRFAPFVHRKQDTFPHTWLPRGYRLGALPDYDFTISGHGGYWPKAPYVPRTFEVPNGTYLIELTPPGGLVDEELTSLIDNRIKPLPNDGSSAGKPIECYYRVYEPQQRAPNYYITPPGQLGVPAREDVITVNEDTQIARLLKPNMGVVIFNSCAWLAPDSGPTRFTGTAFSTSSIEVMPWVRRTFSCERNRIDVECELLSGYRAAQSRAANATAHRSIDSSSAHAA
ncbi:MAG TPA: hypothetical protein VFS42_04590 [Burkholderiaceae bacterium]|nr:hypothetical protein [Burkholderiaceae bacterium]